ncbi:MAG: hypothetical protein ACI8RZ_002106 [Myxococcota bacterium]|jgi:hypothetical protein
MKVELQDAMLFPTPNDRAWRVLIGVVDALGQQLDEEAFAHAIGELAVYAERFPDDLRACPRAWMNIFFDEVPDPRLRLVRCLNLSWGTFGWSGKNFASWVSMLATAPHISSLTTINLYSMQSGKTVLKAITALFLAAKPTRWRAMGGKTRFEAAILAALSEAGVASGQQLEYLPSSIVGKRADAAALDAAEVQLTIGDEETFAAVLAREDLDHVVSLDLDLDFDWRKSYQGTVTTIATPRWQRLRHLRVRVQTGIRPEEDDNPSIAQGISSWLQHARPIYIELFDKAVCEPLLKAGVFQRAMSSILELYDVDAVKEVFAADHVRVMGIIPPENTSFSEDEDTTTLLAALPPGARAALRSLEWRLSETEFPMIETLIGSLPGLVIWCPNDPAVTNSRDAFVRQLAASPSTEQVRLLIPTEPYHTSGKTPTLAAKHRKLLDKGQGTRSGAYVVYDSSSYPYNISW